MKEISLTKNKVAIVDDCDYEHLSQWKWYYSNGYARRTFIENGIKKSIYMHQYIVGKQSELETDHINGNKLDNRRSNLRQCTSSQNSMNTHLQRNNTSGYRGVSFHKRTRTWISQIVFNKKAERLGYYKSKEDAILAYENKARELFGEFYKE